MIFVSDSYAFPVLLIVFAIVGVGFAIAGLLQAYDRPKEKENGDTEELTDAQDESDKENN